MLTPETGVLAGPSGQGGPIRNPLAVAATASEGGGGSSDGPPPTEESAKLKEQKIGTRQERSYAAHERQIRDRVAAHAQRSGNEHQANRTLETFAARVLEILKSMGTASDTTTEGQTKNAALFKKTVLEFLKDIDLHEDVGLLQQFYEIRVRTRAEVGSTGGKAIEAEWRRERRELAEQRDKLDLFKRSSEYLVQILRVRSEENRRTTLSTPRTSKSSASRKRPSASSMWCTS